MKYLIHIIIFCLLSISALGQEDNNSCLTKNMLDIKDCLFDIVSPFSKLYKYISYKIETRNKLIKEVIHVTKFSHYDNKESLELKGDMISAFKLTVDEKENIVLVEVRIQFDTYCKEDVINRMKKDIEMYWSNKVNIVTKDKKYPVIVKMEVKDYRILQRQFPDNNDYVPHFFVQVTEYGRGDGRSDTAMWNITDIYAPMHEFGHYIGAKDEYGITDGVDYTCNGSHDFSDKMCTWTNHIMHCNKGVPQLTDYFLILKEVKELLNEDSLKLENRK